jgi:hypothetical protein
MNPRQLLIRKVVYVALMIPLVVTLAWLGMPPSPGVKGAQASPGGVLAQMRERHKLNPTNLGDIDPTSETLKLATLGMRGVASTILWEKANDYKMRKDWTNLSATLNQITKLQPNFVAVWRFQGWNLSYNVSAEFDDYRERYRWVIRGIEYLEEGTRYNKQDAILVWDVGWFISQKIGRSDERREFRVLFRNDDDFHGSRLTARRDNWLVGKARFEDCLAVVDGGGRMRGSPVLYRSDPAKCQMNYSEAIEIDGTFGEVARMEWQRAANEWHQFGMVELPTTFGHIIRLNDLEPLRQQIAGMVDQLDAMQPGIRDKIREEKIAALTDAQREAMKTPEKERSVAQFEMAYQAEDAIRVTHEEVASRVKGSERRKAQQLVEQIAAHQEVVTAIEGSREIVNFAYWRLRAQFEQEADTVAAREAAFQGEDAFDQGLLLPARDHYERGIALWRKVLDKYPILMQDESIRSITAGDLTDMIASYRRVLRQLDEPLPSPFLLQDVLDAIKEQQ